MQCNRITRIEYWQSHVCDVCVSAHDRLLHYICLMERIRKDKSLTVRITNEARDMLRQLADHDNRSDASWIENAIRRAHQELTAPQGKAKK